LASGFVIDHGNDTDPINGEKNYRVLEHESGGFFVYENENGAIEYIVDKGYDSDDIVYFPSGLTEYSEPMNYSDFDFKYGNCPSHD
jgi:hypothetical protein